jgi:hypothetical protein
MKTTPLISFCKFSIFQTHTKTGIKTTKKPSKFSGLNIWTCDKTKAIKTQLTKSL